MTTGVWWYRVYLREVFWRPSIVNNGRKGTHTLQDHNRGWARLKVPHLWRYDARFRPRQHWRRLPTGRNTLT